MKVMGVINGQKARPYRDSLEETRSIDTMREICRVGNGGGGGDVLRIGLDRDGNRRCKKWYTRETTAEPKVRFERALRRAFGPPCDCSSSVQERQAADVSSE